MAPKEKRQKKKKSLHQSIQSVAQVFPGTSNLSLPTLSSTFPALYSPGTPSYSLDLCRLMLETGPTSEEFDGYYVRNLIRNLIKNLLKVHGLAKDSQAVKDYKARQQGLHPSPDMSDHTEEIVRTSDLTLEQQYSALETVYQNYVAGAQYLEKKATETSRMLKDLDTECRRVHSDESGQLVLTPFKPDEETSDESTEDDVKQEQGPKQEAELSEEIIETVTPVPNPDLVSTEMTMESVRSVPDAETITPIKAMPESQPVRRNKISKLVNFFEVISRDGVQNAVFAQSDEEENKPVERPDNEDESLLGAVGGVLPSNVASERQEEEPEEIICPVREDDNKKDKKKEIITIPFNPSQMQIPILQPNLLITSDVGPASLVMTTGNPTIPTTTPETQDSDQTTQTGRSSSAQEQTDDDDEYGGLRLPKPIKDSDEKYPKDKEEDDSPLIISPSALGGVSHQITSRSLELPIGSPRNYEILDE